MKRNSFTFKYLKLILGFILGVYFLYFLIVLLIPTLRPAPWGVGLPSPMVMFTSEHYRFSIRYPLLWYAVDFPDENQRDKEEIASLLNVGLGCCYMVDIQRNDFPSRDIQEVINWGQARAAKKAGYKPGSITIYNTQRFRGYLFDYEKRMPALFGPILVRCNDWYILQRTIGYDLTFCVNKDHWGNVQSTFEEIRQSFILN